MLVCIAILLGGLVAYAVRFRINLYLKDNPLKRIDKEFVTKPLLLLPSFLSLLFLGMVKPLAVEYSKNSTITDATIQLCIFYIIAKSVLLVVRSRPVAWFIALVIMVIGVLDVSGFMKITTAYLSAMSFDIGNFKISVLNMINGIVILVVVLWIAGLLSRTLES